MLTVVNVTSPIKVYGLFNGTLGDGVTVVVGVGVGVVEINDALIPTP